MTVSINVRFKAYFLDTLRHRTFSGQNNDVNYKLSGGGEIAL